MKRVTIRNDFHNRSITVAILGAELTSRQVRRIREAKLCPFSDCKCAGPLGARPAPFAPIDINRYEWNT